MTGTPQGRPLYHLALAADVDAARASGRYEVSSLGRTLQDEGFIHLSYGEQVAGTAERYYREVTAPLVLLVVDAARAGALLRVEGGFPHLYGPLPLTAVVAVLAVGRDDDGGFSLPPLE